MELIRTVNLNFEYALAKRKSLSDISLAIDSNDFITLAGPSGSGKTTLLRQLKPELWPVGKREGEILYQGEPIAKLSAKTSAQNIGMVFQSPDDQLVMDNVIQELAFSLENIGLPTKEIQKRIAELISFLGMQDLLYEDVQNLSGGQKQLVNLAAVLILRPKVLLLDEPTAQLDPIATKEFISLVKRIHDELGIAVVISEHVLEDILPLSNKMWVVDDGQLQETGTVTDVLQQLWQQPKLRGFIPDVPSIFLQHRLPERLGLERVPLTVVSGRDILQKQQVQFKHVLHEVEETSKNEVVKLKDVSFEYDKNGQYILDELSLSVNENDWLAIIGKNGTGKTTLLKVMMGMLNPRRGSIKLFGKKLRSWEKPALYRQVGYLSQNPAGYFTYDTVTEEYVERAKQVGLANPEQIAQGMMTQMGITKIADQNPHDGSGGEQQLIALGLLLISQPKLLLLDEPTKGLDPIRRVNLGKILKRLQQTQQLTIIMVSHDMAFSARFANKCALLFTGKIVSKDEPHEFFAQNFFYTTMVNRLLRYQLPDVIDREEVE